MEFTLICPLAMCYCSVGSTDRNRAGERKEGGKKGLYAFSIFLYASAVQTRSSTLPLHCAHCTPCTQHYFLPLPLPSAQLLGASISFVVSLNLPPISVNHPALNGCALKSSKQTLLAARILTDANVMCKEEYKAVSGKKGQGFIWSIISLNPHSHAVAWS